MSNMSYCRYYNTLADLRDCRDNMNECYDTEKISESETKCRKQLIKMCVDIAEDYGHEVE